MESIVCMDHRSFNTTGVHLTHAFATSNRSSLLSLEPCVQRGISALMAASADGHLEVVKALLAAGANTEARDDVGRGDHHGRGGGGQWICHYIALVSGCVCRHE